VSVYVKKNYLKTIKSVDNVEPFYSRENMEHLRKAVENINQGKIELHDIIEVED